MYKAYLIKGSEVENVDFQEMTLEELQQEAKRQADKFDTQTEFDLTEFQEYFNKGGTDSSVEYLRFVTL